MNLREWARATQGTISKQPPELHHPRLSVAEVEMILRSSVTALVAALSIGNDLRIRELGQLWVEDQSPRVVVSNLKDQQQKYRLDASVDVFNILNRANVDEVSSVYGSPVFCGGSPIVPRHYKDAATLALQHGNVSCGPQIADSFGPAPLNFPGGAFLALGLVPVSIPSNPNPVFGLPRTMFNPRQFQFSLKLSF